MELHSKDLFPPNFNEVYTAVVNHLYDEYELAGGRGSCKSSTISLFIVLLVMAYPFANVAVFRKFGNTLRMSVFEQMQWAIEKLGVSHLFKPYSTSMRIVYKPTGQRILFSGVDDTERVKSLKVKTGYFAVAWFEEETEFTPEEIENVKLTVERGGSMFWIFSSYNPPSSVRNWKNADSLIPKKNRLVHRSTYKTVPREWLGEPFFAEAEEMKARNRRAYDNIFEGLQTGTGRNIFENVQVREITQEEINAFEYIYEGVDWGYYPDPFRWNATSYDSKNRVLYIFDELTLYKHGNWEASEALKAHIEGNFQQSDPITADCAEPKSIGDWKSWGWNIRGDEKGKGSYDAGMKWLQNLKAIIIDPVRCPAAADEFANYEHEIDKRTGEILEGYPQGQPDHSIADVRYQLERVWKRRGA